MMTIEEKQALIVNALVKGNEQGKLAWKPFEADPSVVYTEVGNKMIYLEAIHQNDTDSIKVEIYADGNFSDKFVDDDLATSNIVPVKDDSWYLTLSALLASGQRKSTGTDEVLDSLLKDLIELPSEGNSV